MPQQRTRGRARYVGWSDEDRKIYLKHLAILDALYAMLRKRGIAPTRPVEMKQPTLEGWQRMMEPSRLASDGRPRSRRQQQTAFARLGVPPELFARLEQWASTPKAREQILQFLERVKFWRDAQYASIDLGRQLHGRARDPHHEGRPEEPGELVRLHRGVELLRFAIRTALMVHGRSHHAIQDHRIKKAVPHMDAVLKALEEGFVDVDPSLPRRTPGRKPGLRIVLHEGEGPRRAKRRDVERTLQNLLLPLHPRGSRVEVRHLSYKLLNPILG